MSAKHTSEPWHNETSPLVKAGDERLIANGAPFSVDVRVLSEENFQRAVKCVNALAGMTDPAAEIAALKAENERMREALDLIVNKVNPKMGARWYAALEIGREALKGASNV